LVSRDQSVKKGQVGVYISIETRTCTCSKEVAFHHNAFQCLRHSRLGELRWSRFIDLLRVVYILM